LEQRTTHRPTVVEGDSKKPPDVGGLLGITSAGRVAAPPSFSAAVSRRYAAYG
jgi:hypothetical protein